MDTKESRRTKLMTWVDSGIYSHYASVNSRVLSLDVDVQATSRMCRLQYLRLIGVVQLVKHARRSLQWWRELERRHRFISPVMHPA